MDKGTANKPQAANNEGASLKHREKEEMRRERAAGVTGRYTEESELYIWVSVGSHREMPSSLSV